MEITRKEKKNKFIEFQKNNKPFLKVFTSKTEAIIFLIFLIIGGIFAFFKFIN